MPNPERMYILTRTDVEKLTSAAEISLQVRQRLSELRFARTFRGAKAKQILEDLPPQEVISHYAEVLAEFGSKNRSRELRNSYGTLCDYAKLVGKIQ